MPNKRSRLVSVLGQVITLSFCWLASAFGQSGPDAALARELLQKAELRAGLVLHLGCGQKDTPGLTAALAESPSIFVHGLALDDAACARARKAIEAAGVTGRAMVECVPLNSLPYLSDLANLVVVEDPAALTKLGVTRKELLRVLAPRGSLLIHERGMLTGKKWTRTVKPRPKAMDDWTHPQHGPDMNMVSSDRLVKFPLGFRWLDGLPVNVNRWAACRGWIVANGRVFTLSSTELDNLRPNQPKTHYLAARDAWNGLPLWRVNCETTDDGSYLTWQNAGPLVADDRRVYVVKKDKTIAVDAATGDIAFTCPNRYAPVRLLLLDGILVASCWESRDFSRAPFDRFDKEKDTASLWATWIPKASVGCVEAYD
ncbi:MAG: class I SAM-dependent methyltransferase, partial [Planctomycetes bacterium]|nr:class I SAM-dependent methyltransferase [Planctomycetota bacterium]